MEIFDYVLSIEFLFRYLKKNIFIYRNVNANSYIMENYFSQLDGSSRIPADQRMQYILEEHSLTSNTLPKICHLNIKT